MSTDDASILCLDQGNTRLKAAVFSGDELALRLDLAPAQHGDDPRAIDLAAALAAAGLEADQLDSAALCSVAPTRDPAIMRELLKLGVDLRVVRGDSETPFPVQINNRETLGADRLCNMAAAWAEGLKSCIVIDAGSAMTLDLMNADGEYEGGLIMPGTGMMAAAMARGGEQLFESPEAWPSEIIGRDTGAALAAGSHWGLLAAAEGLVARLNADRGREHTVVLTGGDGPALAERWRGPSRLEEDCTLRGLLVLARH